MPPDFAAALAQGCAALGLALPPQALGQLAAYAALLQRWSRVHNLTALEHEDEILSHHLLDCLAIVRPIEEELGGEAARPRILDAGSGGGLPGIPLAIARPAWQCTLLDAVQKKTAFLEQARIELGLRNVSVRHERLEAPAGETFDAIVSRAFSSLADFTRLTVHRLAPGGRWLAMKGRDPSGEVASLPGSVECLRTITLRVPRLDEERRLVVMRVRPGS